MAFGLSTLTDAFTGQAGQDAAKKQQQFIQAQQAAFNAQAQGSQAQGLAALQSGTGSAADAIRQMLATSRGDISGNLDPAIQAILRGQTSGVGALTGGQTGGLAALQSGVGGATAAYDPLKAYAAQLTGNFTPASALTQASLGVGGPAASDLAAATYQASPGFKNALNVGLEGIVRNANAAGMGAGGNQARAAGEFATNAALQDYNNWRTALLQNQGQLGGMAGQALANVGQGVSQAELTGGTGGANIYTGTAGRLSDLYSSGGTNTANLYQGTGQNLANLTSQAGSNLGNILSQGGVQQANLLANILQQQGNFGQATLKPMGDAYTSEANAISGASKNLWNAIGQAATFGMGGGLGSLSGSLGNLAMGSGLFGTPTAFTKGAGLPYAT